MAATGDLVSRMQGADDAPTREDSSVAPTQTPVATGTEVAQPVATEAAVAQPTTEAIPTAVAVPTPCPTVEELLANQGERIGTPGRRPHVRIVETEADLNALWDTITAEGTSISVPKSYTGGKKTVTLPDGTFVGWRTSKDEGETIDIHVPGEEQFKVHVKQ